ncbi:MAG: TRAP transporter small permease [Elioraea sp.]|nr:TRAP transporter small permease [Elioraea sp.]
MSEPAAPAFDRAVQAVLGVLVAAVLFAMMALTCVDVVGRYLLTRPVPGALEIIEILVAATVFLALPLVTLREEHVTADVFDALTPDWVLRIQHTVACLLSAGVCLVLAWRLALRALRMLDYGDTTAVLKITLYPLAFTMSAMMALAGAILLVLAFRPPVRRLPRN